LPNFFATLVIVLIAASRLNQVRVFREGFECFRNLMQESSNQTDFRTIHLSRNDDSEIGEEVSYRSIQRALVAGCLAAVVVASFPLTSRASHEIPAGFDLFDPLVGSRINVPGLGLIPIVGVPISSFPDFGGHNLGDTDSILQRKSLLTDIPPV